jgi:hypothetical protein
VQVHPAALPLALHVFADNSRHVELAPELFSVTM